MICIIFNKTKKLLSKQTWLLLKQITHWINVYYKNVIYIIFWFKRLFLYVFFDKNVVFLVRARIEKLQRISETVSSPYSFDDSMQRMAKKSGIKEDISFRGQAQAQAQAQEESPIFTGPKGLFHNLNPFGHVNAVKESDFLKVHFLSFYICTYI